VLQASVGGITVGDVALAEASDAIVVGFNVVPDEAARSMADERGIEIRRYDIIYKLTDDVRATLEGRLKPEKREVELGTVLVQKVFSVSRYGNIAGCRVLRGTVERSSRVRLIREQRVIGEYGIDSLRREKDDVSEVRQGMECGIKLQNFNDIKEGDVLESFKIEEVARTF
jgi:translation initiation factor IF-2